MRSSSFLRLSPAPSPPHPTLATLPQQRVGLPRYLLCPLLQMGSLLLCVCLFVCVCEHISFISPLFSFFHSQGARRRLLGRSVKATRKYCKFIMWCVNVWCIFNCAMARSKKNKFSQYKYKDSIQSPVAEIKQRTKLRHLHTCVFGHFFLQCHHGSHIYTVGTTPCTGVECHSIKNSSTIKGMIAH